MIPARGAVCSVPGHRLTAAARKRFCQIRQHARGAHTSSTHVALASRQRTRRRESVNARGSRARAQSARTRG
eukprot:4853165-Pleurochrysis_carterae.AAC.3